MAELIVAILGLDKLGASIALRLQAYAAKGGKHRFTLVGYDSREDFEKPARKLKVFDRIERQPYSAVESADIVIMNVPYEDLRAAYEGMESSLRGGVVILDTAVIKQPSLEWAGQHLGDEYHVIGFTAVIGSEYMLEHHLGPEYAGDDYFHDSTIYLTPSVSSDRDAIELAVNFSAILGGKPHFLDPAEHDSLTAMTEEIPQVLSVAAYAAAMSHNAWQDAQRLTNPPFNVLTRYLLTHHPDALRDEWLANAGNLTRSIDDVITALRELQVSLNAGDEGAVEAFLIAASDEYQQWINRRHKGEWDDQATSKVDFDTSIAGSLFGGAITKRIFGGSKNDDK